MPTDDAPARILVGAVARAHGIRGEVSIHVWSEAPDRFAAGSRLTALLPDGSAREVVVESTRPASGRILVRFQGFTSRAQAEGLHGATLAIAREAVAPLPPGRYYRFELVGLEARTPGGRVLGRVVDVYDMAANEIFAIEGPGGELLVPASPGVVVAVDREGGCIVLEPPAGLPGLDEE